MQEQPGTLAPVVHRVVVPVPPERADAVLVGDWGRWWPLLTHGVYGAGSSVRVAGGVIVETSASGEASVWGAVMDHVPGRWFEATWHPGQAEANATRLSFGLEPLPVATERGVQEGTLVKLEHAGFERRDDGATARSAYARDWPAVLHRFAVLCAGGDPGAA